MVLHSLGCGRVGRRRHFFPEEPDPLHGSGSSASGKTAGPLGHAGPVDIAVVEDVAEFAELAAPLLAADPSRHTVLITVLDAAVRGGAPVELMVVAREAGRVAGVAVRSPGRTLLVSAMPVELAPALADLVVRIDPGAPGVTGPIPEAEVFARALADRTGTEVRAHMRNRLFVLDALAEPTGVPGRPRSADESDVDLLAQWRREFAAEVHAG